MVRQIASALHLDVPYIVDSFWRRAEYNLNRCFRYGVEPTNGGLHFDLIPRRGWQMPIFWLYVVVLIFVAYGPRFAAPPARHRCDRIRKSANGRCWWTRCGVGSQYPVS